MSCTALQTGNVNDVVTVSVTAVRGDTVRLSVELGGAAGPLDLSGWSWRAQIRNAAGAQVGEWVVLVTGAGMLDLSLSPASTTSLGAGDFSFDLEATDPVSDVQTVILGRLRLREGVSQ